MVIHRLIMTPMQMEVLQAVIQMKEQGKRMTVKSIAEHTGRKWPKHVQDCLVALRNDGLVSYNAHQCGTIQPRVRWIPANEL